MLTTFVAGVIGGSFAGYYGSAHRRPFVLLLLTLLLTLAACCSSFGTKIYAVGLMTLAMGAENVVFERDGEVHIGLTYMTGTLVKLGQRITASILGDDPFSWTPYLLHWMGLVAGAVLGSVVFPLINLEGLWIAAGASALLTIIAIRI